MNRRLDAFIEVMAIPSQRHAFSALIGLLLFAAPGIAGLVCVNQVAKTAGIQRRLPPRGSYHALVIFARFLDEAPENAAAAVPGFAAGIFDPDLPGSLTHFYTEMSGGQLHLTGEVLPRWYTSDLPGSEYQEPEGKGGYADFVLELLHKVDADVDLGRFDNDGPDGLANSGDDDGFVDLVFVNTQSTPNDFIIGGATGVANLGLTFPFISDDRGADQLRIRIRSDSNSILQGGTVQRGHTFELAVGSMAHEFGHLLGLPDLFDLDFNTVNDQINPQKDSAGIGYWGLMGRGALGWNELDGPNPFSAWSLQQLGWIGPDNQRLIVVDEDIRDAFIGDIRDGGNAYQLPGINEDHYYLVVHRRPDSSYYERNLPGSGLLVWEIDSANSTNNREEMKRVDLVCADGLYADAGFPLGERPSPEFGFDNLDFWAHDEEYKLAHAGNLGDAGDFFDGDTYSDFWAGSNPSPLAGIRVGNIRRGSDGMVADLILGDESRAGLIVDNERWDGKIVVVGDITVASGARLLIGPGADVSVNRDFRSTGQDRERVEIVVDGELAIGAARGTVATISSAAETPRAGDWHGIIVKPTGQVRIVNAAIRHVHKGVGGARVLRHQILQTVEISQATHSGIHLPDMVGDLTLQDVEITRADSNGLGVTGTGKVTVDNCVFANNGRVGVTIAGSRIFMSNSRLADNGVEDEDGANLELGPGTGGEVVDSEFARGVGILCRASREVRIRNNQLLDSSIGLLSLSSRPWVEANQFLRNDLAMRVTGQEVPSFLALNIIEGDEQLVESTALVDLNVRNNWWGRDDEVWIGERMTGQVDWQPILNVDPRLPVDFGLQQNYPNPFNGSTIIGYAIGIETPILVHKLDMVLEIRNVTGGLVRRLVHERAAPGRYTISWDGENDAGKAVASGVYVYILRVGPIVHYERMMVLK